MKKSKILGVSGVVSGVLLAITAKASWWIVFAVLVAVAATAGGAAYYQFNKWKKRVDEIEQRREQQEQKEEQGAMTPPGATNSTPSIVWEGHWWIELPDVVASSANVSVSPFHPVVKITWITNKVLHLSLTNDSDWVSGVSLADKYGLPRSELRGTAPVMETMFKIERSTNMVDWKVITPLPLGVSADHPTLFRDGTVSWSDPSISYRAVIR